MKILIDTQVFVWLADSLNLLLDTSNEIIVSFFSLFEIIIKASLGKITFDKMLIGTYQHRH